MKKLTLLALAFLVIASNLSAQDVTVDEIIEGYFENTGGKDAWMNLKGMKMTAKINQGGIEFPVEFVQMRDGKSYQKITLSANSHTIATISKQLNS